MFFIHPLAGSRAVSKRVINMLITEWSTEEAQQVWFEEGMEKGMERGMEKRDFEIARNALARGMPIELIHDITGLDYNIINKMQAGL